MSGGGAAELAVSVRGPHGELPVRIKGDVQTGFTAVFTPTDVGAHTINVEYNGYAVQVNLSIRLFYFYTNFLTKVSNRIRMPMHLMTSLFYFKNSRIRGLF